MARDDAHREGRPAARAGGPLLRQLPEAKALTRNEKLHLVRLHWAIENNRHWTLDVAFKEDDHQPCQTSPAAVEVTCWLRALAYNLVANLRARGPRKDKKALPWKRAMEKLKQLLFTHSREELLASIA